MENLLQKVTYLLWGLLLLITLCILGGEPPIGPDPDLESYHSQIQILVGVWVGTLVVVTLCTSWWFFKSKGGGKKPEHF